jgi:hypothetical protein
VTTSVADLAGALELRQAVAAAATVGKALVTISLHDKWIASRKQAACLSRHDCAGVHRVERPCCMLQSLST